MHQSVLLHEVIDGLRPSPGKTVIDATLGGGGHAEAILDATGPNGRVIGCDRDATALLLACQRLDRFGDRFIAIHDSYANLAGHRDDIAGLLPVDGIVLDAGLSSLQLDDPERGFSFRFNSPLDMRFDQRTPGTAADILNGSPPEHLAKIFAEYGEVPAAASLARAIVTERQLQPLLTTRQLLNLIDRVLPRRGQRTPPASRVFQALRIAVNHELEQLQAFLPLTLDLLAPGGRLVIISFHSLEDRIVKQFIVNQGRDCVCPPELPVCRCTVVPQLKAITKKPIIPQPIEIEQNPRSRSAKLRIAEKI